MALIPFSFSFAKYIILGDHALKEKCYKTCLEREMFIKQN